MRNFVIVIAALTVLVFVIEAVGLACRMLLRPDAGGDPRRGVAILAGGLRFFGFRWGLRSVPAGLRKAGFGGKFMYWPWHSGLDGWLILPALLDRNRTERRATRLSSFIERRYRSDPSRPIYLFGVSAGGYVVLRAIELLPDDVRVQSAALLSSAVAPRHDLTAALSHVQGRLINSYSVLDFVILGAGTAVFGTPQGKHTFAAGMVGLRRPTDPKVLQLAWRPWMILTGRLGGHSSCSPPSYLARYIMPVMGIGKAAEGE